jgi:uncharacterized protein YbjT (DUF2867 family)
MKALIIGATGATGKDLVNVLLQDPVYTSIIAFVRRSGGQKNDKLIEIITNFENLEAVSGSINGDVFFSCLGTTLKVAGSRDKQWQADYEIPSKFASLAKRNGVKTAVLLSAYGASPSSKVFYSSMKGKLEEQFDSIAFDQYIIFRPGLLLRKDTDRSGEKSSAAILKFLNRLGLVRKFRPMPTTILAEKMAKAPLALGSGRHVIELDKIFGF